MKLLQNKQFLIIVAALIAVAVAAAIVQQRVNRYPIPFIPQSSLLGQAGNVPINIHKRSDTTAGVVVPAHDHNIVITQGDRSTTFPVLDASASANLTLVGDVNTRFWVYEYTGTEPPFGGRF